MTTTFCVSGAVLNKAGTSRSTDFDSDQTAMDRFINQAESMINATCRYNYTDTYAALNDDVKKILEDVASSHAAIQIIQYDMSGYTSNAEAANMINTQRDIVLRGLSLLRDKKVQDFINGA